MRKGIKKLVTALLISTMIITSLSACGKTESTDTDTVTSRGNVEKTAEKVREGLGKQAVSSSDLKTKDINNHEDLPSKSDRDTSDKNIDDNNTIDKDTIDRNTTDKNTATNIELDVDNIVNNIATFQVRLDGNLIDLKDTDNYTIQSILDLGYSYVEITGYPNALDTELEPDQYTLSDRFENSRKQSISLRACNITSSTQKFADCQIYGISGSYSSYYPEETPDFYIEGLDELRLGTNVDINELDAILDSLEYEIYKYDSESDSDYHTREVVIPSEKYYGTNGVEFVISDGVISEIILQYM